MATREIGGAARAAGRDWLLLVEDDDALGGVLAEALRDDGWTVARVADGLRGFEAVHEAAPDLVVLDLNLPRLYGQVLLRALKRDPATAGIPVVVTTAHLELLAEEDRPLAAAVLRKPFDVDDLLEAVRAARALG